MYLTTDMRHSLSLQMSCTTSVEHPKHNGLGNMS